MTSESWHEMSVEEVLKALEVDSQRGLSSDEVERRIKVYDFIDPHSGHYYVYTTRRGPRRLRYIGHSAHHGSIWLRPRV